MAYSNQLKIPKLDNYFYVSKDIIQFLKRIEKLSLKHPVNVLVSGKQGCGKSSLVQQFASYFQRPLATFQVGLLTEPGQLFGQFGIKNGETFYQENLFPKAISTPRCVIHLEEINRPEHPKALNELFSVLSENRSIWVDMLGQVQVSKEVVFFATMNYGEEFIGTEILDAALRDRFYILNMDYLPVAIEQEVLVLKTGINEQEAEIILKVINKLRNDSQTPAAISIRHSLMIAELVAMGASIRDAMMYGLQVSKDILETMLLSLHVEIKETTIGKDEYIIFVPN